MRVALSERKLPAYFVVLGLLAAAIAFPSGRARGVTRLVPEDFATIQAAIDASASLDTVLIGPGTYRGPGNRDIVLHGRSITVRSRNGPETTIIDCENTARGFYLRDYESRFARIEGLTIQNGRARVGDLGQGRGGGIICSPSSPTIVNCRILNCRADSDGGGLALIVFYGVLDGCVVSGNSLTSAYGRGGGIWFEWAGTLEADLRNCVITGNRADRGAGICFGGSGPNRMTNCTITANVCTDRGGGIYAVNPLVLERCIVWGNCGPADGAEIRGSGTIRCSDIDTTGVLATPGFTYDEACIYTDPSFCAANPCGLHTLGDWTLDAASACLPGLSPCGEQIGALGLGCGAPTPTGACCLANGSCLLLESVACVGQSGTYMGDGSTCESNPCQPTPVQPTTWGRIKASFR